MARIRGNSPQRPKGAPPAGGGSQGRAVPGDSAKRAAGVKKEAGVRKPSHRLFDFLVVTLLIISLVFIGYQEYQRRQTQQKLQRTSQKLEELKKVAEESGVLLSQEVLAKVKRHFLLPDNPKPTVATITNAEQLKKINPFYKPAENGDHLIITEKRAILYDPDRDIILDVVPVQIEKTPPSEEGAEEEQKNQTKKRKEGKVEAKR